MEKSEFLKTVSRVLNQEKTKDQRMTLLVTKIGKYVLTESYKKRKLCPECKNKDERKVHQ